MTDIVEIARRCGDRAINCEKECPYFTKDENCVSKLLNDLADKIERIER